MRCVEVVEIMYRLLIVISLLASLVLAGSQAQAISLDETCAFQPQASALMVHDVHARSADEDSRPAGAAAAHGAAAGVCCAAMCVFVVPSTGAVPVLLSLDRAAPAVASQLVSIDPAAIFKPPRYA